MVDHIQPLYAPYENETAKTLQQTTGLNFAVKFPNKIWKLSFM
jgi:hypothetical protein